MKFSAKNDLFVNVARGGEKYVLELPDEIYDSFIEAQHNCPAYEETVTLEEAAARIIEYYKYD